MQNDINYQPQCFLKPNENISYRKLGPQSKDNEGRIYQEILYKAIEICKRYPLVRGMIVKTKIRVSEIKRHDQSVSGHQEIEGKKYVDLNLLLDTGSCGGVLDPETAECYTFPDLSPRDISIGTIMGTTRKNYQRNRLTALTTDGTPLNIEAVSIGNIGRTKRDAARYTKRLCKEFGFDEATKTHFMLLLWPF